MPPAASSSSAGAGADAVGPDGEVLDEEDLKAAAEMAAAEERGKSAFLLPGETVAFSENARVRRYDAKDKAWKDLDVGLLRLAQAGDSKRARLLFAPPASSKLFINAALHKGMKIAQSPAKPSALDITMFATDYTGAMLLQRFLLKFKTPELAKKLKDLADGVVAQLS